MSAADPSDVPTPLPPTASHALDDIWASCEFMKVAVHRSVDFAKSSHGIALQPALETVGVTAILGFTLRVMRQLHTGATITIAPLPEDVCPAVVTDRHWLSENMICLLGNAIKYSDSSSTQATGASVVVSLALVRRAANEGAEQSFSSSPSFGRSLASSALPSAAQTNSGSSMPAPSTDDAPIMLRFTVADHGIGVSAHARARLFQPFSRAQSMAGGTGLGLYSLRKRTDALGGRCGVDARADGQRGSEFWFEFPYRPDHAAMAAATAALREADEPPPMVGHDSCHVPADAADNAYPLKIGGPILCSQGDEKSNESSKPTLQAVNFDFSYSDAVVGGALSLADVRFKHGESLDSRSPDLPRLASSPAAIVPSPSASVSSSPTSSRLLTGSPRALRPRFGGFSQSSPFQLSPFESPLASPYRFPSAFDTHSISGAHVRASPASTPGSAGAIGKAAMGNAVIDSSIVGSQHSISPLRILIGMHFSCPRFSSICFPPPS
jgi:hypothetical protein